MSIRARRPALRVAAYTPLHYGAEYLRYAIRSVIDYVDEYHVLYTAQGSHGHVTEARCPETRHQLYREAVAGAGDKLRWHDGIWPYEGAQRDTIFMLTDADLIVALDADEIWMPVTIKAAIQQAADRPEIRGWRVPMVHFWRSFYRAVLHDPAYPVRVINTHSTSGEGTVQTNTPIAHMGYAQSEAIIQYKLLTHGHRNEFRQDCDWLRDRFLANAQRDCHPVGSEYWNPEPVTPADYLPDWMRTHPYWTKEIIR